MQYGLEKGKVSLVEYTDEWRVRFNKEKNRIIAIIGDISVSIHHIGSTAIPGIKAKPIVDILLVFQDFKDLFLAKEKLEYNGYTTSIFKPLGHFIVKNEKDLISTAYIHLMHETEHWQRYIIIRDYLITHPDIAKKYEELKIKSATKYQEDRIAYTASKTALIESILKKAKH